MFGLLFDETPTYEELKNGTPKLAPLFKLNENFKESNSLSVGQLASEWNTFETFIDKLNQNFHHYQIAI